MTPGGIWVPPCDAVLLSGVCSNVPSDCLADCLTPWWPAVRERVAHRSPVVITLDNGPENHRRRTQFMRRRVDLAPPSHLPVRCASSPPYHRQDNPIERGWGM